MLTPHERKQRAAAHAHRYYLRHRAEINARERARYARIRAQVKHRNRCRRIADDAKYQFCLNGGRLDPHLRWYPGRDAALGNLPLLWPTRSRAHIGRELHTARTGRPRSPHA